MNSKFTLALIALVGIGVFALPSTMALFSGQHSFYNIDATGNQIPCTKCHGDVKAELSSGYSSVTGTGGPHAKFKCEYCHRAESGFASGDDAYAKITYTSANATHIYLVTTIENHEQGNFPKTIVWFSGMTVDNWQNTPLAVQDMNGKQFYNNTVFLNILGQYAGSLSTNGVVGTVYNFDFRDEIPTEYANGTGPKDTNPATQNTAFNAHNVTWSGINEVLNGAGSREVTPGTRYHAASLVSCLECHGGDQTKGALGYEISDAMPYNHGNWVIDGTDTNSYCSNCHYGASGAVVTGVKDELMAGGFGLTDYAVNSTTGKSADTGEVEAHNDFVRGAADGSNILRVGYGAANDACVACHTHVAVDINFQKKYALKFNANAFQGGNYSNLTGKWAVGGFSAQGTVNVEAFGNQSGNTFAVSNKSYNWNASTTLYINNSQVVVKGLNNAASDNQSALSGGLLP